MALRIHMTMVVAEVDIIEVVVGVGVAEVEVVEAVMIVSSVGNLVIGLEIVRMAEGMAVDFPMAVDFHLDMVVVAAAAAVALTVLEVAPLLLVVAAGMEGMIDMVVVSALVVQDAMVMVAMAADMEVAMAEVVVVVGADMTEVVTVMGVVDQSVMREVSGTVLHHMVEGQVGALPMMIGISWQDVKCRNGFDVMLGYRQSGSCL